MPAVFVHGNPETAAIWDLLFEQLERADLVALSPPGFGAPVPDGWVGDRASYAAWLTTELEAIDGPIDLVGHDWGGGHVMAVAMARSDLLRSWTVDVAGIFHPEYVWHDMAQMWQTPEVGEETVAAMVDQPPAARTTLFESLGMPPAIAARVAAGTDSTMGRCILGLYRDAAQPAMAEAGASLPGAAARPGLVLAATEDPYVGGEDLARWSASQAGAQVTVLNGLGHWWMLQDPAVGPRRCSPSGTG